MRNRHHLRAEQASFTCETDHGAQQPTASVATSQLKADEQSLLRTKQGISITEHNSPLLLQWRNGMQMSMDLLCTKQVMSITGHKSPLLLLQHDNPKQTSKGLQSHCLMIFIPLHVIRALQYGRKAPPSPLAHSLSRSYEVSIDSTLRHFADIHCSGFLIILFLS